MAWRQGKPWREAISDVKQALGAAGAECDAAKAQGLIDAALDQGLASSARPHEVSGDLALLAQQLTALINGSSSDGAGSSGSNTAAAAMAAAGSYCRLLSAVLRQQQQLQLAPPAAARVAACLRQWLDAPCGGSVPVTPRGVPGPSPRSSPGPAERLQIESLIALSELLPHHLQCISDPERAALLASLTVLLPSPPSAAGAVAGLDAQCHAAALLGTLCKGASSVANSSDGGKLTEAEAAAALRALVVALVVCCSGPGSSSGTPGPFPRRPVEDPRHARLYGQLLRSVTAAVAAHRSGWGQQAGEVCEAVRRLLQYGAHAAPGQVEDSVAASEAAAAAAATGSAPSTPRGDGDGGRPRYVPPHLRAKGAGGSTSAASSPVRAAAGGGRWTDAGDASASDSGDASDGDGRASVVSWRSGVSSSSRRASASTPAGDTFAAAALRVRLAALLLVQAMAQADPQALHPHWSSILPVAPAPAALAARPLSPHLVTVLLHDPHPRARALAAATLAALLQGNQTRALLAVAEARDPSTGGGSSSGGGRASLGAPAGVRGFTTLSASLGQIVVALHQGLAAAVASGGVQQQQQQQQAEGQEPTVVVAALRALCVLCSAAPYERLPQGLLPTVTETAMAAWQSYGSWNCGSESILVAGAHADGQAWSDECTTPRAVLPLAGSEQQPGPAIATAAAACIAQALSTKQPSRSLAQWLVSVDAKSGRDGGDSAGGEPTNPNQGAAAVPLWVPLLHAARSPAPLLRIEALAALRSMCANYAVALPSPGDVLPPLGDALVTLVPSSALARKMGEVGLSPPSSPDTRPAADKPAAAAGFGGGAALAAWGAILAAAHASMVAAGRPDDSSTVDATNPAFSPFASPSSSPRQARGGGRRGRSAATGAAAATAAAAAAAAAEGEDGGREGAAGSTAEEKAAQHAARLVGSYLAAWAQRQGLAQAGSTEDGQLPAQQQQQQQQRCEEAQAGGTAAAAAACAALWEEALGLLLGQLDGPCPPAVRSSLLTTLGEPGPAEWAALPAARRAAALAAAGRAATGDAAAAARAAACKALGALCACSCAAAVAAAKGAGTGTAAEQATGAAYSFLWESQEAAAFLRPLAAAAADSSVAVRQAAAWAVANASDGVRALQEQLDPSSSQQQGEEDGRAGGGRPALLPTAADNLALLCDAALAGARDSDKVRANGVRALGNLLSASRPCWPATAGKGAAAGAEAWPARALGVLQSCLATGGPKTQWNACCAAAGALGNAAALMGGADASSLAVSARLPALLLALLLLLRDSSNFKVRTQAAAALAAPPTRDVYGESFADTLLVVLSALDSLESGGSSGLSASAVPAAAGGSSGTTGDGASAGENATASSAAGGRDGYLSFRYAPALAAQLRSTLLHLLALLDTASDAPRLREPLGKRRALLRRVVACGGGGSGGGGATGAGAAAGGGRPVGDELPADPFGQQQQQQQQQQQNGGSGSGSRVHATAHVQRTDGPAAAAAAGGTQLQLRFDGAAAAAVVALDALLPGFAESL